MSFISKFFTWVGNIFKKGSGILEDVVLPAAIAVTNALKIALDADTTDILGHIAGAAGAALEEKIKGILNDIIPKLQLAQQFKGQDPATILANIVKLLGDSPLETQTSFYIEFSGMVAHAYEDGKIDQGEAAALAKYWYDNHPVAAPAVAP